MRNIIITGGELFNKGAQAMTFVAVDECKKRFPDHEIYVLSEMDLRRPREEKEQYAFQFTGWYPVKLAKCQANPLLRTACLIRNGKELQACEKLYRNCDLMIDVSGYGLGNIFGINQLKSYIEHLEFAKCFGIPYYLMPQSFGPFDFNDEKAAVARSLQSLLSNVKVICAREQEGYNELISRYNLNNVQLLPDLVLNNRGVDLSNIYKEVPTFEVPPIMDNSVGVIPNQRISDRIGREKAVKLYATIIALLLERGKNVYVLSHATPDQKLCQDIKTVFLEQGRVIHLDKDYSCLEYNEIVKQFDYIVASRFHAIVHAYRNETPCIAIGWAVKYRELLKAFEQERYAFDIYSEGLEKKVEEEMSFMDEHTEMERERIRVHLDSIQQFNVFDILNSSEE